MPIYPLHGRIDYDAKGSVKNNFAELAFGFVKLGRQNVKLFGCGSFRTGDSGAVERKMDLSYYGSGPKRPHLKRVK